MWATNVALEFGKLLNKQNERKRRQKILLVFAPTIPFMTHDPILFYSFFIHKISVCRKRFPKSVYPFMTHQKPNVVDVLYLKNRNVSFNLDARCVHTCVFYICIDFGIHTRFYSILVQINSKNTSWNQQWHYLRYLLIESFILYF